MDDADKDRRIKRDFKQGAKIDVSRFKGLGEMPPAALRETTMDPARRTLLKVVALPEDRAATSELVESLMGRRPELRFQFIQDHARMVEELDVVTDPATEGVSPRYADLETWPPLTVLHALWEGQLAAVAALQPALPVLAAAAEAAADRLRNGGRLAYAGAGTSGRIGVQDGAELPPTFDWPLDRLVFLMAGGEPALIRAAENVEDRADRALDDVHQAGIGPADVLVGLAASGATAYTVGCVVAAREAGALTIGIANSPASRLLEAADHKILIETGPEALAGSTRMKAGTAQKVALNLFSTAVMTQLGRVYRGQMVDMLARNEKLRRRAVRMLRSLTGASTEQAAAALTQAGGRVKPAVLIVRGLSAEEADALLAGHGGDLRRAEMGLTRAGEPAR